MQVQPILHRYTTQMHQSTTGSSISVQIVLYVHYWYSSRVKIIYKYNNSRTLLERQELVESHVPFERHVQVFSLAPSISTNWKCWLKHFSCTDFPARAAVTLSLSLPISLPYISYGFGALQIFSVNK